MRAADQPDLGFDPLAILTEIRARTVAIADDLVPDLSSVVDGALPEPLEPFALLPVCTGLACGGEVDALVAVAAPVVATALALRIVDDIADDDNPHAVHRGTGAGRAANLALALPVASLEALRRLPIPDEYRTRLLGAYICAFLSVCGGQEHDISDPPTSLIDYRSQVASKTVPAFEFSALAGALASTASPAATAACRDCGEHIGWMTQILDDIETLWDGDGGRLLWEGRGLLPVLVGLSMDHPGARRLQEILEGGGTVTAALPVLDETGVRRYLISEALNRRDAAKSALGPPLAPAGATLLDLWLDWAIGTAPSLSTP